MNKYSEIYIVSTNNEWADILIGGLSTIFVSYNFQHLTSLSNLWNIRPGTIVIYDKESLGNPSLNLVSPGERGGEWVIVNAKQCDTESSAGFIALGFSGLIDKAYTIEMLPKAIRTVISGQLWFSREAMSLSLKQATHIGHQSNHSINILAVKYALTVREQQVFLYLLQGSSNKEIAMQMNVSPSTIKCHVSSILLKTGKNGRRQLFSLLVDNEKKVITQTV
ncbi:helix-turn-helix transcriptional regulator [Aliivibrio fischeri]|uniref:helix-turn-helix transcriptional regulator n=1 Tax=Aliivibrio fischeri TaxID=668 RepID=UPI0009080713|nr:LuxR C-terminal-related transcriptional regulator [Aliivibrio fischeri]MUJ24030.1 DNA-binding response regulator [Aliivibrio fischeri]MUK26769.1 DNA-binding response regulator [Aliivibrio fischeri]MUK32833.1 DNA-binding response regulator [Aliivibrio fischeri]MUK64331.1 DNA-binding response regulator [Aliivibrio fischeri]